MQSIDREIISYSGMPSMVCILGLIEDAMVIEYDNGWSICGATIIRGALCDGDVIYSMAYDKLIRLGRVINIDTNVNIDKSKLVYPIIIDFGSIKKNFSYDDPLVVLI